MGTLLGMTPCNPPTTCSHLLTHTHTCTQPTQEIQSPTTSNSNKKYIKCPCLRRSKHFSVAGNTSREELGIVNNHCRQVCTPSQGAGTNSGLLLLPSKSTGSRLQRLQSVQGRPWALQEVIMKSGACRSPLPPQRLAHSRSSANTCSGRMPQWQHKCLSVSNSFFQSRTQDLKLALWSSPRQKLQSPPLQCNHTTVWKAIH